MLRESKIIYLCIYGFLLNGNSLLYKWKQSSNTLAAHGLSLVVASRDYSLTVVLRLLIKAASLVAEHRF